MKPNYIFLLVILGFSLVKPDGSWIYYDQKENISKYRYNWQELRESMEKAHGIHDIIVSFQKTIKNASDLFEQKRTEVLSVLTKNTETLLLALENSFLKTKNRDEILEKINQEINNANQSIKNLEMIFIIAEELEKEKEPYLEIIFELENYTARVNNLFTNIEGLNSYREELDTFITKLNDNISYIEQYKIESWDNFKKIDELVNNKVANELIQKTEYNLQQVQTIKNFIYGEFLQSFNTAIQNILKSLNELLKEIQDVVKEGNELFAKTDAQNESIKEKLKAKEDEKTKQKEQEEQEKKRLEDLKKKQELEKQNTFFNRLKKRFDNSINKIVDISTLIKNHFLTGINFVLSFFRKSTLEPEKKRESQTIKSPAESAITEKPSAATTEENPAVEETDQPEENSTAETSTSIQQPEIQLIPSIQTKSLPSSEKVVKPVIEADENPATPTSSQPETVGVLFAPKGEQTVTELEAISEDIQVLDSESLPQEGTFTATGEEEAPSSFEYRALEPDIERETFEDKPSSELEAYDGAPAITGEAYGPNHTESEHSGGFDREKKEHKKHEKSRKRRTSNTVSHKVKPTHKQHRKR